MSEMGALGLLGSTIPEAYGGAGLGYVSYGLAAREVERVDSGYRSAMSVQSSLVMHPINAYGSEEQKKKYLPKLASGEWVGCFGLTEPDAGSDPAGMRTRAEKIDGGYRLTGAKMWITNSPIAAVAVVWAKSAAHGDQIEGFIVERGMKGFSTPKIEGKLSLRASVTGEIVLDDVERAGGEPAAQRRRPEGPVRLPQSRPLRHRLGRDGRGRILLARAPGNTRSSATSSGGRLPRISSSRRSSPTCRPRSPSACRRPARRPAVRRRPPAAEAISLIKRNNCGKALDIAREARDMHGGNGISEEYHVIASRMNLETVNTYEGTHDVHALILGRGQTGIQAFF